MMTNREGLTFKEWCAAARAVGSESDRRDWREGVDPTEVRKINDDAAYAAYVESQSEKK